MAPQALSDSSTSTGIDKGSIVLICVLVAAITLAIGGGAAVRKLRQRRLRAAHIQREREKGELGLAGVTTPGAHAMTATDSDWSVDDMPLGVLRTKSNGGTKALDKNTGTPLHVKLEALVQKDDGKSVRSVSSPMLQLAGPKSTTPTTTNPRRSVSAALLTPKYSTPPGPKDASARSSVSPKNKLPLVPSVGSVVSWTHVGHALLEPSRTVSTFGGASPRSQRLSAVMVASSPTAMLIRATPPPPAITISVPTSASLGAQARAEWEMDMQMHAVPFEEYIAWGQPQLASDDLDEHIEQMLELDGCYVVEDMQFASLDIPREH